jgi:hypothetical protein
MTRVALGFSLAVFLLRPAPALASGLIANADGEVAWRAGTEGDWNTGVAGLPLADGAHLRTGEASLADIVLDNGALVKLGPLSQLSLLTGGQKSRAVRLESGALIGVVPNAAGALEVKTSAARADALDSARFSVSSDGGTARVRAFTGTVSVTDKSGRKTALQAHESLEAGRGAGLAVPSAVAYAIPGSGWLIDPPEGLQPAKDEAGLPYWLRVTQETVSVGDTRLSVKSVESITAAIEDEEWRQGLVWPQDCRRANNVGNAILSGRVTMGLFEGTPAFTYRCVVPGGLRYMDRTNPAVVVWRTSSGETYRYRDLAVDFSGGASHYALWVRYAHSLEIPNPGGLDEAAMDKIRESVGKTAGGDHDGPALWAYFEALQSLRPAAAPAAPTAPAAPAQNSQPAEHGVPLLR